MKIQMSKAATVDGSHDVVAVHPIIDHQLAIVDCEVDKGRRHEVPFWPDNDVLAHERSSHRLGIA